MKSSASPETSPHTPRGLQYSLSSILLTMTFAAVCAGLFRWGESAGVFFLVFAVPAYVRTVIVVVLGLRRGRPFTLRDRLAEMFFSVVVMLPVYVLGTCAFVVGIAVIFALNELHLVRLSDWAGLVVLGFALAVSLVFWCWTLRLSPARE